MEPPSGSGDPHPKRRRPPDDADLLSALPDELLVLILELVGDSRAAVSTSALSRRWRRLDPARWLPAFDLSVAAHLPPEYAGTLDLYRDARAWGAGDDHGAPAQRQRALAERVGRCEDRAMEAYVRGIASFLRSPQRCPRARSLRLEFFVPPPPEDDDDGGVAAVAGVGNGKGMAACLASAVRWPVVEHLAVEAVPRAAAGGKRRQRPHLFPEAVLDGGAAAQALATLHVKNCLLSPSGHGYGAFPALSRLTLEITPRVDHLSRSSYLNNLMRACRQLVSLRLVSCNLERDGDRELFTVDLPPASRLQELIMETCNCGEVKLVNAPSLERLVLERCSSLWSLMVESAPRLKKLMCRGAVPRLDGSDTGSLRFVELSVWDPSQGEPRLVSFFRGIPNVEELALCFRGRRIWVEPEHFVNWFDNLKKLSIDLPRVWPLHWIKELLEVAACLEKLHIDIFAPSSETSELAETTPCDETPENLEHTWLKEIEMVGFEGTGEQMDLVRFFMSSCSALKTVILIRHHALLEEKLDQHGGITCPSWLMEDEKAEIVSQLRDGIHSDAEIVLG